MDKLCYLCVQMFKDELEKLLTNIGTRSHDDIITFKDEMNNWFETKKIPYSINIIYQTGANFELPTDDIRKHEKHMKLHLSTNMENKKNDIEKFKYFLTKLYKNDQYIIDIQSSMNQRGEIIILNKKNVSEYYNYNKYHVSHSNSTRRRNLNYNPVFLDSDGIFRSHPEHFKHDLAGR